MSLSPHAPPPSLPEAPLSSVQPGGGVCYRLELAWGQWRRAWLRRFQPSYVARMHTQRQGVSATCPAHPRGCDTEVIDPRDLKFCRIVCGYSFPTAADAFAWRGRLGFARWGLAEIVIFTVLALVLSAAIGTLAWLGTPSVVTATLWAIVALLWLFILSFFRDPERPIPADPLALVSPADGTVTEVAEVADPSFPGGTALRVSIFLSVFNVHVNRCPRAGRVTGVRYFPGKFLNAMRVISAVENEQLWIDFEDAATGATLRVKQIAGAIARRIVCQLRVGDAVAAGERFGMIKVGSRTEVLLPPQVVAEKLVRVGQKVSGGSTVLLRFTPTAARSPSP